jgi:hypothetical protein
MVAQVAVGTQGPAGVGVGAVVGVAPHPGHELELGVELP